jgi:hypothetical protein
VRVSDGVIISAVVALIVLFLATGIYDRYNAPCETFRYAPTRNVPARCLGYFK